MSFAVLLHVELGLSAFAYLISLSRVLLSHSLVAIVLVHFFAVFFFLLLGGAKWQENRR